MNNLISQYGNVIVVNLINKGGYEGPLGDEYVKNVQLLNDSRIKYSFLLSQGSFFVYAYTHRLGTRTLTFIMNAEK